MVSRGVTPAGNNSVLRTGLPRALGRRNRPNLIRAHPRPRESLLFSASTAPLNTEN